MKRYRVTCNVGKAKYLVSFHDGIKTHADGSDFFDVHIFSNKVKMNEFIKELKGKGYSNE